MPGSLYAQTWISPDGNEEYLPLINQQRGEEGTKKLPDWAMNPWIWLVLILVVSVVLFIFRSSQEGKVPSVTELTSILQEKYEKISPVVKDRIPEGHLDARVLTYNIFCHDKMLMQQNDQNARVQCFFKHHANKFDVIGLQEMFFSKDEQHDLLQENLAGWHNYVPQREGAILPSGLAIYSRYPILATGFHRFQNSSGVFHIASNGVSFALVAAPGKHLFVFNLHLCPNIDSHDFPEPLYSVYKSTLGTDNEKTRAKQMVELEAFMRAMMKIHKFNDSTDVLVTMGDWNINKNPSNPYQEFDQVEEHFRTAFSPLVRNAGDRTPSFPSFPGVEGEIFDHTFVWSTGVTTESARVNLRPIDVAFKNKKVREMNSLSDHLGINTRITDPSTSVHADL